MHSLAELEFVREVKMIGSCLETGSSMEASLNLELAAAAAAAADVNSEGHLRLEGQQAVSQKNHEDSNCVARSRTSKECRRIKIFLN